MTKHTILVVEYDISMWPLYESIFRRHQDEFVCHVVHTGTAALKFLEQKQVDLLLLATDLPGMPGIDVLQLVRAGEKTKDLPVVLLTPSENPEERLAALQRGADHYQGKPGFNVNELLARIRHLLTRESGGRGWTRLLSFLMA